MHHTGTLAQKQGLSPGESQKVQGCLFEQDGRFPHRLNLLAPLMFRSLGRRRIAA